MGCEVSTLAPITSLSEVAEKSERTEKRITSTNPSSMGRPISNARPTARVAPIRASTTSSNRPSTDLLGRNLPPQIPRQPLPPLHTIIEESYVPSEGYPTPSLPSTPRPLTRSSSIVSLMDRPPSRFSVLASTRALAKHFTIDTSRAKSNQPVVSLCAKKLGIEEYPEGRSDGRPCDIYWHSVVYSDLKNVVTNSHSKVNKFPGMTELAKKIALTHSICSMQRIFPQEYAFYPKSWFLPAHYGEFQKYVYSEKERIRRADKSSELWFIVKPDEGAQGTGIYMIRDPSEIKNPQQKQLIQEYIADPYLMSDRLKFDFRVYGVIRSLNPLSIYVAREGSKRLLSTVFHQLAAKGLNTKKLWKEIKLIIVKTVLAMVPELILHYEHHFLDSPAPQCFQIIGFDIMVKEDGMPILLEVNAAPSLTIDHTVTADNEKTRSIVDEVIKVPLIRDTILLELGILDEQEETETIDDMKKTTRSVDDLGTLNAQRASNLSQIFPSRYGSPISYLLFLDKAMYIYMHFVQLKINVNITVTGLKQFVKKCSLSTLIEAKEVEEKAADISYGFTGNAANVTNGLPFHAFLHFLFYVADLKFPSERSVLAKLQKLMAYCDMSLRHYGVRSARLRRTEIDGQSSVEIYLLPNRIKRSRSGGSTKSRYSNSPGHFKVGGVSKSTFDDNNNNGHNNHNHSSTSMLSLPKIHNISNRK